MPRIKMEAARVNKGLTQAELAEKMGVSRLLVNRWEQGKSEISVSHLIAFCAITGFSVDDIILPEMVTKRDLEK